MTLHAVTFRNDPQEYAFTHIVPAIHETAVGGERIIPGMMVLGANGPQMEKGFTALCGRELPETMRQDLAPFDVYMDKRWIDCQQCQEVGDRFNERLRHVPRAR